MTSTDTRADYTAGLRALADLLDEHPDLPLPDTREASWYLFGSGLSEATQKAEAARIVRILGGHHDKEETSDLFRFKGSQRGLKTQVIVDRTAVCERVVTGTREVVVEVPDPDALAAVPTTTVTKTVEDVEWVCRPLLADEAVSA